MCVHSKESSCLIDKRVRKKARDGFLALKRNRAGVTTQPQFTCFHFSCMISKMRKEYKDMFLLLLQARIVFICYSGSRVANDYLWM